MLLYQVDIGNGLGYQLWKIQKVYCYERTTHQTVCIAEVLGLGKALFLDDRLQSAANDVVPYHEAMLQWLPSSDPGDPRVIDYQDHKSAVVLGSGPGAATHHLLKFYPGLEQITEVDLDESAVKLYRKWLPEWHHDSYKDPRVQTVYANVSKLDEGLKWGQFDLVVIDLSEAFNKPAHFYDSPWIHKTLTLLLKPGGVAVMQSGQLLDGIWRAWKTDLEGAGWSVKVRQCPEVGWSFLEVAHEHR